MLGAPPPRGFGHWTDGNKTLPALATAISARLLAGGSSSARQTAPTAAEAGPTTASQTAAAPYQIPASSGEADKTADFKRANANAAWAGQIKSATETEPGGISIDTSGLLGRY